MKYGKKTGEPLHKGEEYFRTLIESSLDIIIIINPEGTITYCNPAVEKIIGYKPDEVMGRSGFDFIHPQDRKRAVAIFDRAFQDPDFAMAEEIRLIHRDGSYRFVEGLGKSYLDDPIVSGMVVALRDISDRKQAENALRESEELYRALVQASPDAVTASDLEGNITYISPQTLQLHGYASEEELLGKNAFGLIAPEEHRKAATNLRKALIEGFARNIEFTLVRKDGSRFIAELNAALIRDTQGQPLSFVAFTRDITERKKMEGELHERNEELEAFAYTISHDLLTPASVVEGYAKAALEADAEGRPEAERECLESIVRGARRMSDLIDSLLQYAQAGHLDAEVEWVESSEIIQEILEDLKEKILEKRVEVILDEDLPAVPVDSMKLHQVFTNLIGNALKHMGNVPRPSIEIGASEGKGKITFRIRDNGVGIPDKLQKKIFEPFKHFSLTGSPGLGIGLATVKRAVEAWGGTVWVESKPGEGTTFYFTVNT